jgi:ribosome-associated protein
MSATTRNANGLKRSNHGVVTPLRAADTLVVRRDSGFLTTDAIVRPQIPGKTLALLAAAAGLAKKAENVAVLDVAGKVDYADFLVLMTGTSDRNVAAIAQGVEADLREKGARALALEGLPLAQWVLIDFVDVVVHVFQSEWREIYDLDGLWMDAKRLHVPLTPVPA